MSNNKIVDDIKNYTVLNVIGTGSFGICYRVKKNSNNKNYVWKAVDYGSMTIREKKLLVTEVNLLKTLKHPYIVKYFGRIVHEESGTLFIVMEWCEMGDLNTLIIKCRSNKLTIEETFVWKVLYQTAKALEACHTMLKQYTVLHRDIKPANIFLDWKYNVKLGDFGLATVVQNQNFSSTVVGTPYYMSPEQIQGSKYNKKSDIWSLGCLIFELCCLKQPFSGKNIIELTANITSTKVCQIPKSYSNHLDKMIKFLLKPTHEYRPSVEVIVNHPTIICNYDVTAKPFQNMEPNISSSEISILNDKKICKNSDYDVASIALQNIAFQISSSETSNKTDDENKARNSIRAIVNQIRPFHNLDPEKITKKVYNDKFLNGLKILLEKERSLRAKENLLETKELILKQRESILDQRQKMFENRESKFNTLKDRALKCRVMESYPEINNTLNTTFSVGPAGDVTFHAPTSSKLDPSKIVRPSYFNKQSLPTMLKVKTNVREKCVDRLHSEYMENELYLRNGEKILTTFL